MVPPSYSFVWAGHCNMCGHPTTDAKTLGRRLNAHQGIRPIRKLGVTTSIQRCSNCGLAFPNPMPVPATILDHYEVAPSDYWGDEYLDHGNPGMTEHAISAFRGRGCGSHPMALDVGAGLGHAMVALQAAGFDTWGIEPSESFRARALQQPIQPDRLLCATIETAELPHHRFDFINMGAVIEHLVDPAGALERAIRWLARSGLILVTVPSSDWLVAKLLNMVYRSQGLDFVTNTSPMHSPYHLYEFTRGSFEAHGRRAGYQVVDSRIEVCDTFMPRCLQGAARRLMATTGTGMMVEVWLAHTGTLSGVRRQLESEPDVSALSQK